MFADTAGAYNHVCCISPGFHAYYETNLIGRSSVRIVHIFSRCGINGHISGAGGRVTGTQPAITEDSAGTWRHQGESGSRKDLSVPRTIRYIWLHLSQEVFFRVAKIILRHCQN